MLTDTLQNSYFTCILEENSFITTLFIFYFSPPAPILHEASDIFKLLLCFYSLPVFFLLKMKKKCVNFFYIIFSCSVPIRFEGRSVPRTNSSQPIWVSFHFLYLMLLKFLFPKMLFVYFVYFLFENTPIKHYGKLEIIVQNRLC